MELALKEAFRNGLVPDERTPRNTPFLLQAENVQATEYGLKSFETITNAISSGELSSKSITIAHPFPQLFRGKGVTLLCTATKIYLVNESTRTLTQVSTYDYLNSSASHEIPSGGTWHFVDMHTNWLLMNGSCIVAKTGWVDPTKALVIDYLTINTGCSFRGRVLFGGFDPDNFWSSEWETQWSSWMAQAEEWGFALSAPGRNWIYWSSIGGGDFMQLFLASLAPDGLTGTGHSSDDALFLDLMRRAQNGMMPMDFQGNVMCLSPFEDFVLVCGEDGISAVLSFPEPVPTFGLREAVISPGLAHRSAIGGSLKRKILVDAEGELWSVSSGLQVTRLGYKYYFAPLLGDPITVSWDSVEDTFFIGNDEVQYSLTTTGLSKSPQLVNSLYRTGGDLVGVVKNVSTPNTAVFETLEQDLGSRKPKTIRVLEFSGANLDGQVVDVYWRFDYDEAFTKTSFTLDSRGVVECLLTCVEFKIGMTLDLTAGDVVLDDTKVVLLDGAKRDLRRRVS